MEKDHKNNGASRDDAERKRRQAKIGQKLRQLYDDVANEPVPDDFLKLLEEADKRQKRPGKRQRMSPLQPADATDAFKALLTGVIPHLRAFARSLCQNRTHADDLAQETLLKAWNARDSFIEGTNFKSWTFTILRNLYYSERRRSWRSTGLDPEVAEATLVAADDPSASLDLLATRNALMKLPDEYREAVILVGAGGLSYEEAAAIAGTVVGTMKSRVSRARKVLIKLLDDNQSGHNDDATVRGHQVFESILSEVDALTLPGKKPGRKV